MRSPNPIPGYGTGLLNYAFLIKTWEISSYSTELGFFSIFENYGTELCFCCVVTYGPFYEDDAPELGLHGAEGKKRERELQNC